MKISTASSSGSRLREAPFPFQQTYIRPLTELPKFVNTLLAPFEISNGVVHVELIVFEPKELIWYLRGRGFVCNEAQLSGAQLQAENKSEATELLECILGQWTDFAFIPSPKEFVIYADHDEYTTIFTKTAGSLSSLRSNMEIAGFKEVEGWIWTGPHSPGIEGRNTNG